MPRVRRLLPSRTSISPEKPKESHCGGGCGSRVMGARKDNA